MMDTVLPDKSIYNMQYPLWVNHALKSINHVIIPDKLSAGWWEGTRIGPHLCLQWQCHVVGVAKIEVTREIHILEDLQIPKYKEVCITDIHLQHRELARAPPPSI